MSLRDQRENDRQEKALERIAGYYRRMLKTDSDEERKIYANQYIAAIGMYVTLTGEEEFTVIEYVSNHLTD